MSARPQRIVLLGPGGAGKSRLARRLSDLTGAPAIILDDVWRRHAGKEGALAFREAVRAAHAGERWISDGNFAAVSFDLRLPQADLIVWVDPPLWLCALRALRRPFLAGEPHRLGGVPDVLRFIWSFERINRPRIEALRQTIAPDVPVDRLRTSADVEAFTARFRHA